jgi:hypothetical protein
MAIVVISDSQQRHYTVRDDYLLSSRATLLPPPLLPSSRKIATKSDCGHTRSLTCAPSTALRSSPACPTMTRLHVAHPALRWMLSAPVESTSLLPWHALQSCSSARGGWGWHGLCVTGCLLQHVQPTQGHPVCTGLETCWANSAQLCWLNCGPAPASVPGGRHQPGPGGKSAHGGEDA